MYANIVEKLSEYLSNDNIVAVFKVKDNAELFEEHFENFPLLPGALTLNICHDEIKRHLAQKTNEIISLHSVQKIQFLQPIRPNDKFFILLKSLKNEKDHLSAAFIVSNEHTTYSDGVLKFKIEGKYL